MAAISTVEYGDPEDAGGHAPRALAPAPRRSRGGAHPRPARRQRHERARGRGGAGRGVAEEARRARRSTCSSRTKGTAGGRPRTGSPPPSRSWTGSRSTSRAPRPPPPRSSMRYRTFGRLGWQVSEIGYGMWGMAGWTGSDDAESGKALDRAVELGCNFFDTAYAYGDGRSERLLRDALVAPSRHSASTRPPRSRPRTAAGPAARRRPSPTSSRTTTSSR